jgi:GNAT superfamily N-acetyltransferase/catechol 2,3-dioxygenase-like lactoylglutathione lyase family enzyme
VNLSRPSCDLAPGWHDGGVRITAIDHVQLAMPPGEERAAEEFYVGLLGLDVEAKPPHLQKRGGCWFENGGVRLHLGVEQDFRPAKKAHVALLVDDLASLAKKLEDAGVSARSDEPLEGYDRVYVDDVFGNRIELMEKWGPSGSVVPEGAVVPEGVAAREGAAVPEGAVLPDGPVSPPPVSVRISPVDGRSSSDAAWIAGVLQDSWGATAVVSRGRRHEADQLPALVAEAEGERVGLATYRIDDGVCELVTIDALTPLRGVGSALLAAAKQVASARGCRQLWLVTTNDNLDALRFYQRRGFRVVAVHPGAVDRARDEKPGIPAVGSFAIPVHDELELAVDLQ